MEYCVWFLTLPVPAKYIFSLINPVVKSFVPFERGRRILMSFHRVVFYLLLAVAFNIAMVQPAAAYLDPATGSAMIQILVATVMGGLFVMKGYWTNIKAFFARGKEEEAIEEVVYSASKDAE